MAKPISGATDTPVPRFAVRRIPMSARRLARDACGATSIEYALIAGLVFMVVAGSIRLYSSKMNTVYGQINGAMSQIN